MSLQNGPILSDSVLRGWQQRRQPPALGVFLSGQGLRAGLEQWGSNGAMAQLHQLEQLDIIMAADGQWRVQGEGGLVAGLQANGARRKNLEGAGEGDRQYG